MQDKIINLEKEINLLKDRNKKVEADKAWETSNIRKIIIAVVTYALIGLYMIYLGLANPWLNALVPTFGFLLSTLTLSWIKKIWVNGKMGKKT